MNVGEIYLITLGYYSDKYLVTVDAYGTKELRRVRLPKTKIDAIRLPEKISITYLESTINKPKHKKQNTQTENY